MNLFEFEDYKDFVRKRVKTFPRRGHGQYMKIARTLGIQTSMVSQIFKGEAHLTVEHALKLTEYFALTKLETEFFITLVHLARAGSVQSRLYFQEQLKTLKERAMNLSERLNVQKSLTEAEQAIFYSAWYYSGIRLITAVEKFRSTEAIAERLDIPHPTVARVVEFLLSVGLLKRDRDFFEVGEAHTYIGRDSTLVSKHHLNWRLKAVEQLNYISEEDLVFTHSIAISQKDFLKIREDLVRFLESYKAVVEPSPSEHLCFLTLDWRKLRVKGAG